MSRCYTSRPCPARSRVCVCVCARHSAVFSYVHVCNYNISRKTESRVTWTRKCGMIVKTISGIPTYDKIGDTIIIKITSGMKEWTDFWSFTFSNGKTAEVDFISYCFDFVSLFRRVRREFECRIDIVHVVVDDKAEIKGGQLCFSNFVFISLLAHFV